MRMLTAKTYHDCTMSNNNAVYKMNVKYHFLNTLIIFIMLLVSASHVSSCTFESEQHSFHTIWKGKLLRFRRALFCFRVSILEHNMRTLVHYINIDEVIHIHNNYNG